MTDDSLAHIDAALEAGEPPAPLDMEDVVENVADILLAAGRILHLRSHDFVETKDVRPHLEILFESLGRVLYVASGE